MNLNDWSVQIDKKLIDEYNLFFYNKSKFIVKATYLMSAIIYGMWGILDIWMAPLSRDILWIARYLFVCPICILLFIFSLTRIYDKYHRSIYSITILLLACINVWILIIIPNNQELAYKGTSKNSEKSCIKG